MTDELDAIEQAIQKSIADNPGRKREKFVPIETEWELRLEEACYLAGQSGIELSTLKQKASEKLVTSVLSSTRNNHTRAAKRLGITYRGILKIIRSWAS